jgi:Dihydrodipicolinate synthase/N-acetylneuraminate lyase
MNELKGICSAICTPMDDNGAVSVARLKNHIDKMIEAGVHIIAVCGGTGEFAFLDCEEKRQIAEVSARHINGRAKLIVQASAIRTEDAVEAALHAQGVGADAVLVLPPYFEGPVPDGVYYHYARISEKIEIPIMAYNVPVHSGFDITPEFFKCLTEIDNVKYIKDTSGDFVRIQELLASGATVFNGSDPFAFYALLAGCNGCFWGAVNAMPEEAVQLYKLVQTGKLTEAVTLWKAMLPANLFFWSHAYNPSIKAATNIMTGPVGMCRKPVMPLAPVEEQALRAALQSLVDLRNGASSIRQAGALTE